MKTSDKIPHIIHYCWMSDDPWDIKTLKCFASWEKHIPEYEYKLWNSKTLPENVLKCPTVVNALKVKKWAFVADYVRIWALYNYGGLYMDLDVELLKSPNDILCNKIIFGLEKENIGGHFIATIPKHPFFLYVLEKLALKTTFMPLPNFLSNCYKEYYNDNIELGKKGDITIYSNDYFNPFFWDGKKAKGELNITENTYCVHWYAGSWIPIYKKKKIYKVIIKILRFIGIIAIIKKIRGY